MAGEQTSLRDAVVWITGASSGIGAELAAVLAKRGARLALSARREERLIQVRKELPEPDRHLVLPLDVARPETFRSAWHQVEEALGPLDVMVLNAGISQRSLALETDIEVDRRLMEVDYFGAIGLAKTVLPAMVQRRSGRVVVVSSLVGRIGTPKRSGYAAAKHALHGFFESLRAEVWESGVRITIVCPGFVHTELPLQALTKDGSPQGRMDRAQLQGLSPRTCATRIARAIESGKDEVIVAGREGFVVPLFRLFPGLFRRLIRRVSVT